MFNFIFLASNLALAINLFSLAMFRASRPSLGLVSSCEHPFLTKFCNLSPAALIFIVVQLCLLIFLASY